MRLDYSVYVICDKSRAHQRLGMLEASKAGRCGEVADVHRDQPFM